MSEVQQEQEFAVGDCVVTKKNAVGAPVGSVGTITRGLDFPFPYVEVNGDEYPLHPLEFEKREVVA